MSTIDHVEDNLEDLDPLQRVQTWNTPLIEVPPPTAEVLIQPETEYDMPEACLYGWLGEQARKLDAPLGIAWTTMLAMFSGQGIPNCKRTGTRANIYVVLAAPRNYGKSRTIERARAVLTLREGTIINANPGSDKGLQHDLALPVDEGAPKNAPLRLNQCLIKVEEMRDLLAKIGIQNSGLPWMLTELWDGDDFNTSTTHGPFKTLARMCLLGGVPCKSADEFASFFTSVTTGGLYDRMIIVPQTKPWMWDDEWEYTPSELRHPWPTELSRESIAQLKEWRKAATIAYPESTDIIGRIEYNIKRIALIMASANRESVVSEACMRAACVFGYWQIKIKQDYSASSAESPDAVAHNVILKSLQRLEQKAIEKYGPDGAKERWFTRRTIARSGNLSRALGDAGPTVYARCMQSMIAMGIVERDPLCNAEGEPMPGRYGELVRLAH
jgi:hypothetical protein